MVQLRAAPWKRTSAPKVGRKWSDTVKSATVSDVISKEDFLAACVLSRQIDPSPWPQRYDLRSVHSNVVSPLVRPSPPPGLELVQREKTEDAPLLEKTPGVEAPTAEAETFQALVQGLPEAMSNECMLRAMLDQARLQDVMHLAFRPNGKALITFSTYASVCQCIKHFNGRQWGASKVPVTATYVKLMKKTQTPVVNEMPQQEAPVKALSADAAIFVPGFFAPTTFSTNAPSFVPSADKMCEQRDRVYSDASTEAGPMSDGADSDMEEQAVCT